LKIINILLLTIVVLLSVAAGAAKVMQAPQEMEFLQGFGFSPALIVLFGVVQIIGGILLIPPKTRLPGVILAGLALILSTALIFIGGDMKFGLFSIIPIALIGVIAKSELRKPATQGSG
jgi:hypothetical protein